VVNVIQSLSNVVDALANRRLLRVGSCGRVRGLLQKPTLPPRSHLWWLQSRKTGAKV